MNTLSIEQKVEEYLMAEVFELENYEKYIESCSNGSAHLFIDVYTNPINISNNMENREWYYSVYVGEKWEDHSVNWDWFYVRKNLNQVLWYNPESDEFLTLEEWRVSEYYRNYLYMLSE